MPEVRECIRDAKPRTNTTRGGRGAKCLNTSLTLIISIISQDSTPLNSQQHTVVRRRPLRSCHESRLSQGLAREFKGPLEVLCLPDSVLRNKCTNDETIINNCNKTINNNCLQRHQGQHSVSAQPPRFASPRGRPEVAPHSGAPVKARAVTNCPVAHGFRSVVILGARKFHFWPLEVLKTHLATPPRHLLVPPRHEHTASRHAASSPAMHRLAPRVPGQPL